MARSSAFATDGEIYLINIINAGKRRGLGTRLMGALADDLAAAGFSSVGLWVLEANSSARAFYARLGGIPRGRQVSDFDGAKLLELGYVWPDISALKAAAEALLAR